MTVERLQRIDGADLDAMRPVLEPDTDALCAEVASGTAQAFRVDDESYIVTRPEGSELVVCALVGGDLDRLAALVYRNAVRQGFETVRFHTKRKGLARMLKAYGPVETETVYRVTL